MLIPDDGFTLTADGALLIDLREEVQTVFRVGPWEQGLPTARLTGTHWAEDPPEEELLPILHLARDASAAAPLQRFARTIPAAALACAARFSFRQLAMLRLLQRLPEAEQLAAGQPLLLWLLADYQLQHQLGWTPVRELLRHKRHLVFAELTGISPDGGKSALRLLAKLEFADWMDSSMLRRLQRFFQSGHWRRFRHVPVLSTVWLSEGALPPWLGDRLLLEAASLPAHRLSGRLRRLREAARDATAIGRALRLEHPEQVLRGCRSFEEVFRLHDRWMMRLNEAALEGDDAADLPPPPIAGSETILPIQSSFQLRLEGRLMHHCVAAYGQRVRRGESYIYRVLAPERATLELSYRPQARAWSIAQLKLSHNRGPSQESWQHVTDWLKTAKAGHTQAGDEG